MQHPTEDPYSAAQQLLGGPSPSFWPSTQGGYGGSRGQQRQARSSAQGVADVVELESDMLTFLDVLDLGGFTSPSRLGTRRHTGATLLHLGSSLGLTRFVAGQLSRGADPNVLDKNGNTPLHHAAMNGQLSIIHRLRLAGADQKIKSIRGFIPADLALSLQAYQAAFIRKQTNLATRMLSRRSSVSSLQWDSDYALDISEGVESESTSRRSSSVSEANINGGKATSMSPAHYMSAWRDSLATQIQQFHESASWAIPNLNLPALPKLPDYQAHSVVRRVSSLFPHRPTSLVALAAQASASRIAPPAYNDLYPDHNQSADGDAFGMKKASAAQAVADAVLDHHFDRIDTSYESQRRPNEKSATKQQSSALKSGTFSSFGGPHRVASVVVSRPSCKFEFGLINADFNFGYGACCGVEKYASRYDEQHHSRQMEYNFAPMMLSKRFLLRGWPKKSIELKSVSPLSKTIIRAIGARMSLLGASVIGPTECTDLSGRPLLPITLIRGLKSTIDVCLGRHGDIQDVLL